MSVTSIKAKPTLRFDFAGSHIWLDQRQKILNRRLTQIYAEKESPQRRRDRREIVFCLSGDDDKQKHLHCGQWPDRIVQSVVRTECLEKC